MQKDLEINAVIGFSDNTYDGLLLHPDNEHIIYPLGSTVVVRHILSRAQTFLRGHDNRISCTCLLIIQLSKSHLMESTQPVHKIPSQDSLQILSFGISKQNKLNTDLNCIKLELTVLHFHQIHNFSPHKDVLKISKSFFKERNMLVVWDV